MTTMAEAGTRIYFIGIAGTAMASVAIALRKEGWEVSGADQEIYPPMSECLERERIPFHSGYAAAHLGEEPDLVVVGNAISRGNPELEETLDRRIPYASLPEIVRTRLIARRESIVIAGTHGKTTTTALTAWMLECAGLAPGFLIGGVPGNFGEGCRMGKGNLFVTEGDEYDTAFFDKRSKFLHYRPDIALINNIEFDHADIFDSLDQILTAFRRLVALVPGRGRIIANGDDPRVRDVTARARAAVELFGFSEDCEWSARIQEESPGSTLFDVMRRGRLWGTLSTGMGGRHNISNILAAAAVAAAAGVTPAVVRQALESFRGVRRRMEIVAEKDGVTVIDDFAHHPTAVRATLRALRQQYPRRRIVALFEPRSNTTTRNIFQRELAESFDDADAVIVGAVNRPDRFLPEERLSPERLVEDLRERKIAAWHMPDPEELVLRALAQREGNTLIVFLSNGNFGGARERLAALL